MLVVVIISFLIVHVHTFDVGIGNTVATTMRSQVIKRICRTLTLTDIRDISACAAKPSDLLMTCSTKNNRLCQIARISPIRRCLANRIQSECYDEDDFGLAECRAFDPDDPAKIVDFCRAKYGINWLTTSIEFSVCHIIKPGNYKCPPVQGHRKGRPFIGGPQGITDHILFNPIDDAIYGLFG